MWKDTSQLNAAFTVEELFASFEAYSTRYITAAPPPAEREAEIHRLDLELWQLVSGSAEIPSMLNAQNATLKCLGIGLVSGLYQCGLPSMGAEVSESGEVSAAYQVLQRNKRDILITAEKDWCHSEKEDLELLEGYAKMSNLKSLEEAAQLIAQPGATLLEFQKFLLASAKAGFAIGVLQATMKK